MPCLLASRSNPVLTRARATVAADARRWGYDEMLLKVEAGNRPAENLYRALGYRVTAEDTLAERPEPGASRVRWVRTSNIVLRKDLRDEREAALHDLGGVTVAESVVAAWREQAAL